MSALEFDLDEDRRRARARRRLMRVYAERAGEWLAIFCAGALIAYIAFGFLAYE